MCKMHKLFRNSSLVTFTFPIPAKYGAPDICNSFKLKSACLCVTKPLQFLAKHVNIVSVYLGNGYYLFHARDFRGEILWHLRTGVRGNGIKPLLILLDRKWRAK